MTKAILCGDGEHAKLTLPDGCTAVSFEADGNAQVSYQFDGCLIGHLNLAPETGARVLEVPAGSHALSAHRVDDGAAVVTVTPLA